MDISGLSDGQAAEAIAAEEIDILVNLNGYFGAHAHGRVRAAARRRSRSIIWAFPAQLGAPYNGLYPGRPIVIPDEERRFYTEKVV